MKYTYRWQLYWWGDRAYEDCIALVEVNVPDNWKEVEPPESKCTLSDITIEEQTEKYLVGTYHTDIPKLIEQLKKDLKHDRMMEDLIEDMVENDTVWL